MFLYLLSLTMSLSDTDFIISESFDDASSLVLRKRRVFTPMAKTATRSIYGNKPDPEYKKRFIYLVSRDKFCKVPSYDFFLALEAGEKARAKAKPLLRPPLVDDGNQSSMYVEIPH